jgi:hypothetical protein
VVSRRDGAKIAPFNDRDTSAEQGGIGERSAHTVDCEAREPDDRRVRFRKVQSDLTVVSTHARSIEQRAVAYGARLNRLGVATARIGVPSNEWAARWIGVAARRGDAWPPMGAALAGTWAHRQSPASVRGPTQKIALRIDTGRRKSG